MLGTIHSPILLKLHLLPPPARNPLRTLRKGLEHIRCVDESHYFLPGKFRYSPVRVSCIPCPVSARKSALITSNSASLICSYGECTPPTWPLVISYPCPNTSSSRELRNLIHSPFFAPSIYFFNRILVYLHSTSHNFTTPSDILHLDHSFFLTLPHRVQRSVYWSIISFHQNGFPYGLLLL